jgi:energy-coupling factor transporter ATP-binding protein EcfA2
MPVQDPTKEEYLAIVSEWSTYGHRGGLVGNAYPIFCISRGEVVHTPLEDFPDPGYVFLVSRGSLNTWDFIRLRPGRNAQYTQGKSLYISLTTPIVLDTPSPDVKFASLLEVPGFDPVLGGTIRNPQQNVTPLFFVRSNQRIYGPLSRLQVSRTAYATLDAIQWAPYGNDSIVYELTLEDLGKQGCRVVTYEHPDPDKNEVARRAIHLLVGPVSTVTSHRAHDRMPEQQMAEWFLRWRDLPEVPEPLAKTLRSAPDVVADSTPEIIRARCRRLFSLFGTLQVLQSERNNAARRFLETEEGKKLLEQQIAREIDRKAGSIEEEVRKRRSELSTEKTKLEAELRRLQADHLKRQRTVEEEMRTLEGRKGVLEKAIGSLQGQLENGVSRLAGQLQETVPLFAALTVGSRNGPAPEPARPTVTSPTWDVVGLPEPTKELEPIKDESALVDRLADELAAQSLWFARDFLANLYVTLKASALNLIMGPPGYGKSSVVSALARALGHGQALLEIAVRRSWSDDRYLLGFFDTFHGRYDPGPTGLATRLLQAQRDWEKDRHGIYVVLLDEFNLAAPEYYFSQLLQTATRPPEQAKVVRLFDPAATHADGIDQLTIYPNVRFWGTINYDETTERLSPRLLDRTGMVFLDARDVLPAVTADEPGAPVLTRGVTAGQLLGTLARTADDCPDELWEMVEPLLALLKRQAEEWGPGIDLSPRVLEGIRRYLANSVGVLPAVRAVDFVFQQRVLPVLRGRGPQFALRVKALGEKLGEKGLDRSARHVQDALALAEAHFGDIDFLAYS